MSDDAITRSMRDSSDEELLAIVSGAAIGYTDQARVIAERVLRERQVELPDLGDLRGQGAVAAAEAKRQMAELEAAQGKLLGREWAVGLIIIGLGGFLLPLINKQLLVLIPFGSAIPIVASMTAIGGFILLARTAKAERQSLREVIPGFVHILAAAATAISLVVLWSAGLFRSHVNPLILLVPPAAVYYFYFQSGASNDPARAPDNVEHHDSDS